MTHVRKEIRDAAASAVTGLLTTGVRVFKSRNLPLTLKEFPALCVFAKEETVDYGEGASFSNGVCYPLRRLDLRIQAYVKDSDGELIENLLDQISAEVETAIFQILPTGPIIGVSLGGQTLSTDSSGDETLGLVDMSFQVLYRTAEGSPEVSI